jgi:hypothetical protein
MLSHSQEVLINCSAPYNDSVAGSSRSLNRNHGSPTSNNDDPTFWVPHVTLQQQPSNLHGDQQPSSDESSVPQTPSSPTSSNRSIAGLSVTSIPIARSDKHIVLTCNSPARPKVSSMQQKLDHTKIDTSLYQEV